MSTLTVGATVVSVDGAIFRWTSGLAVDADGCPTAYGPAGTKPRDALANAGHPGSWWGLACDAHGQPIVQGPDDPAPGYYVSTTALCDASKHASDPARYVDSAKVPYLSVPPDLLHAGVHKGDVALVSYRDVTCAAIVADVGPHGKIGEGSIALAIALGLDGSPRHGGIGGRVSVILWAGSTKGWPRTVESINEQVAGLSSVV